MTLVQKALQDFTAIRQPGLLSKATIYVEYFNKMDILSKHVDFFHGTWFQIDVRFGVRIEFFIWDKNVPFKKYLCSLNQHLKDTFTSELKYNKI